MRSFASVSHDFQSDGTVTSRSSGMVKWTSNTPAELSHVMGEYNHAAPSGTACAVSIYDAFVCISQPYCSELPTAILAIIEAEPTGELAEMFRGYIRHTMMPPLRRIADTLREYAACEC